MLGSTSGKPGRRKTMILFLYMVFSHSCLLKSDHASSRSTTFPYSNSKIVAYIQRTLLQKSTDFTETVISKEFDTSNLRGAPVVE